MNSYIHSVFLVSSGLATSLTTFKHFVETEQTIGGKGVAISLSAGIGSLYITDLMSQISGFGNKTEGLLSMISLMWIVLNYLEMIKGKEEEILDLKEELDIGKLKKEERDLYVYGIEPDRAYKELLSETEYLRLEELRMLRRLEPRHKWMGEIIRNSMRKLNGVKLYYEKQVEEEENDR